MPTLLEYMELDPFCLNGNEYRIYSIYYDTANHDVIRQNSSKPVYKEKLRIRSYDVPSGDSPVFVELKKKLLGTVYKRRISLKYSDAMEFLNSGGKCKCGTGTVKRSRVIVSEGIVQHSSRDVNIFVSIVEAALEKTPVHCDIIVISDHWLTVP